MREYLVAVVGGRRYHGRSGRHFDQFRERPCPGQRGVAGQPVRLDRVSVGHPGGRQRSGRYPGRRPEHDSGQAFPGRAGGLAAGRLRLAAGGRLGAAGRAGAGGEVAAERERAQRGIGRAVAVRSTRHSTVTTAPRTPRTAGPGRAPRPRPCRGSAPACSRRAAPGAVPSVGPHRVLRLELLDDRPLRPQPAGQRRVPGQVNALLDADDRGQGQVEDLLGCPGTRGWPGPGRR